MDGHDIDDYRGNLQLRRIRIRRCYTGYAIGSLIGGYYDGSVSNIPERTIEYGWEGWVLSVHHWVCGHCDECAIGVLGSQYPRDAALRYCAWVSVLRRSGHYWLHIHCALGWAKVREKDYARVSVNLQFDWRSECGCYSRSWCCHCCTDWRHTPVQPVVSLRSVRFRHLNACDRNYLSKCKSFVQASGESTNPLHRKH